MKADEGTDIQLHPLLISAPDGDVATLCPRHFASGERSRYLLRTRMSEPQFWKFRRRENICHSRNSNSGFSRQYPCLYTNYDTPTQGLSCKQKKKLLVLHQYVCVCCGHGSNGTPNNFSRLRSTIWVQLFCATFYNL